LAAFVEANKKAEVITDPSVGGNDELLDFLTNKAHAFDTYEHVELTMHAGHVPTLFVSDEGGKILAAYDVTNVKPLGLKNLLSKEGFNMGGSAKRAKLAQARRAAHIAKQQQQQSKDDILEKQ